MVDVTDVAIPLENIRKQRLRRWFAIVIIVQLIFLGIFSFFLWTYPIGPTVSLKNITLGTVKKGNFVINIQSTGKLKPRIERWVTANVSGIIQNIYIHPGTMVKKGYVVMTLRNPTMITKLQKAQFSLTKSLAEEAALKAKLADELYSLEDRLAVAKAQATTARMRLEADKMLLQKSVISRLQYESDDIAADNAAKLVAILQARIVEFKENIAAQLQIQRSLVASARSVIATAESNVTSLRPKSQIDGEVQTVPVQAGQNVSAGTEIARIANVKSFDAKVYVKPSEAAEVEKGQLVKVMLPNLQKTIMRGTVLRISPNVTNNVVPITVRLHKNSQKGARPQMEVSATIHVGQLANVLSVAKPDGAHENSIGTVFVLSPKEHTATSRKVRFGLASSSGIQVLSGLRAGDRIVLSDTAKWNSIMRIRK